MAANERETLSLVFDADDTLWDSNIHFLEAFDEFIAAFAEADLGIEREQIKLAVREAELDLIQTLGYGRRPYVMALHRAADALPLNGSSGYIHDEIERIGANLIERHCELLPGVEPTLVELSQRHTLLLFTKGQRDEQLRKLERSRLHTLFSRVETPREKDVEAYRRLVRDAQLHPGRTWMIGNSPRSDINPAVRAGLHAIYIPHPHTWELEHEEVDEDDRIVEIPAFRELLEIF
jgi:putative hydrolase of the HAD superfamily